MTPGLNVAEPLEMAGETEAALEHYRAAANRTTSLPEQRYLTARAARLNGSSRPLMHFQRRLGRC